MQIYKEFLMKKVMLIILNMFILYGCSEDKTVNDPQPNLSKQGYEVKLDQTPMPQGGIEAIQANVVYPPEAKEKGIEGKVIVIAYIDKEGNVKMAEVANDKANPLLDKAAMDAVKKVKFSPGLKDGKTVDSQVAIPIVFKLNGDNHKVVPAKSGDYYLSAETMPEIIGGIQAVMNNIKYPESERKAGNQGKVVVQVYVDEEGNIYKSEVVKGVNPVLNQAALDAFKDIKFKPGTVGGKPVKVAVAVPVTFRLQ
jgi:TonB family protein